MTETITTPKDQSDTIQPAPGVFEQELAGLMDVAQSPVEQQGAVNIVLDQAIETAGKGELLSKQGDRAYSSEEVVSGIKDALKLIKDDSDVAHLATIVPRSHGLREVFKSVASTESGRDMLKAWAERQQSAETITREEAGEIGEATLDAAGVESPDDEVDEDARIFTRKEMADLRERSQAIMDQEDSVDSVEQAPATDLLAEMVRGLSEDDVAHLKYYAFAEQDKFNAQAEGSNEGSREAQDGMGYHLKGMSEAAKKIASTYSRIQRSRS